MGCKGRKGNGRGGSAREGARNVTEVARRSRRCPMLGAAVASLPDARHGGGFVARCSAQSGIALAVTSYNMYVACDPSIFQIQNAELNFKRMPGCAF